MAKTSVLITNLQLLGMNVLAETLQRSLSDPSSQRTDLIHLFEAAVADELDAKTNKQQTSLLRRAKLSHTQARIEEIAYFQSRGLSRDLITQLASGAFMEDHRNLCIYGASGTGKSYLGKAFGVKACEYGFRTRYIGFPQLMRELIRLEKSDSLKYEKRIQYYSRIPVLIIDEWLLGATKTGYAHILLELMDSRYGDTTTIFCTQINPDGWAMAVDLKALGESILGRALSNSFTIHLKGDDLRKSFDRKP